MPVIQNADKLSFMKLSLGNIASTDCYRNGASTMCLFIKYCNKIVPYTVGVSKNCKRKSHLVKNCADLCRVYTTRF